MKFKFLFFFLILFMFEYSCIAGGSSGESIPIKSLIWDDRGLQGWLDIYLKEEEIRCDIEGEEEGCSTAEMRSMSLNPEKRSLHWAECRRSANMACEAKLEQALLDAIRTCADLQTDAQECCHEPEQCIGGSLVHALDSLGKMNEAIGAMKGGQAHCDAIQQTRGMYGGAQGAMAGQCRIKANTCTRECNQKMGPVVKAFEEACDVSINSEASYKSEYTCSKDFFDHYTKVYKGDNEKKINIAKVPEDCKRTGRESNRRIQDMGTNLGASLLASAQECEAVAQQYGWDTTDWGSTTSYNPGPTVYNTSGNSSGTTDYGDGTTTGVPEVPTTSEDDGTTGMTTGDDGTTTLQVGSTGGESADPTNPLVNPDLPGAVGGIPDLGLGGGGNKKKRSGIPGFGDLNVKQAANPFAVEPTMDEQEPNLGGDVNAQDLTGGLIGGSGGSGGGGLGGGSGGGLGGGGGYGGYGGKGRPEQVALGLKSGGKFKGYGGGGGSSSGRSSRGSRGRKKGKKDDRGYASVDLDKWLPKGKQLNNKTNKYGSPHDSIFKRMSDRIQWMCRKERIDCR